MSLVAEKISYSVGDAQLLRDVSLSVKAGRVHAILGPNGAGKSTLLRLLARELRPTQGRIRLHDQPLEDWDIRALARQRAVLSQSEQLRFGFSAAQVVALGRLPCRQHPPLREAEIVDAALAETDTQHLRHRIYPTLSGGERQRVQLARALAQVWEPAGSAPQFLLLDEPTASLDLRHQHSALRVARKFAAQGMGVAAVLHDPNLALQYADDLSLLCCGELVAQGAPQDVLTIDNLRLYYGVEAVVLREGQRSHIAVQN